MNKNYTLYLAITAVILSACNSEKQTPNSGTVQAGSFNVYYERTGKGTPVLLLHAGLMDHTMWEEQVKGLSSQYEVITMDMPFHGKTTGVDTVTLMQDIIKTLLDSLHLDKISIAGLSMGSVAAQDFIIAYPQRVSKAILISAGVNGLEKTIAPDSVSGNSYAAFGAALQNKDTVQAAKEFTKAWAEGVYRSADSLQAPVSKYVYQKSLENLRLHKAEHWPALQQNPPAVEKIASINLPVLIIHGDKDLPYVGVSCQYMEKTIPGAKRVVLKNVAHMLNMEKPAELNEILLAFLKN